MDLQTDNLLQERRAMPHVISKPVVLHKPVHNEGLAELKSHICHLRELNGRLKYMMTEIHSLITDAL